MADFQLTPSVTVTESFSDNVDQNPDSTAESAFTTDVTTSLNLRWQSARVTAAADSASTFRYQTAGDDKGLQVLPTLSGLGTFEISRDLFFIDTNASVSQELINTRNNNTEANRNTVQDYSASPYLVGHFGGFADGELRYTLNQVLASNSDGTSTTPSGSDSSLSDAMTHTARARLSSGTDFTQLSWTINTEASKSDRTNDDNVTRHDSALNLEYAVARWLSILGSGGYQHFDDGDPTNDIDAPTWNAGVRLRPGPRTNIEATYGVRDDETSLAASLSYRLSARTTFTASYDERLQTGQDRIARDLSFVTVDPATGALIDSRTGLPFDPNTATTSLVNDTERTKTLRLALVGTRGRNSFQVEAVADMSKQQGGSPTNRDDKGYEISGSWQRRLSTQSDFQLFSSYQRDEFDPEGRTDNEYQVGGVFNYVVYTNVDAFASYTFTTQTSTSPTEEFTENLVTVGLHMSF